MFDRLKGGDQKSTNENTQKYSVNGTQKTGIILKKKKFVLFPCCTYYVRTFLYIV